MSSARDGLDDANGRGEGIRTGTSVDKRSRFLEARGLERQMLGGQRLGASDRDEERSDLRFAAGALEGEGAHALLGIVDRVVGVAGEHPQLPHPLGGDAAGGEGGHGPIGELQADVRQVGLLGKYGNADGADLADVGGPAERLRDLDVMDHEVEHHVDVEGAARERREALGLEVARGGLEGEDRLNCGVVVLHVPDTEHDTRRGRRRHQLLGFGDARCDGLLDEHVPIRGDQAPHNVVMAHGRGGDDDGLREVGRLLDAAQDAHPVRSAELVQPRRIDIVRPDAPPTRERGCEAEVVATKVTDADHRDRKDSDLAHGRGAYRRWAVGGKALSATLQRWEAVVIDSHAHLAMIGEEERAPVMARAAEAGVTRILVPATGAGDLEQTVRLHREWPRETVVALGFHPHEASTLDSGWKRRLEALLAEPGVVAVGEIGLDYHYDHSPREDQRRVFAWQLALAMEAKLPVVLHQREAWLDFLAALDSCPGLRGVAHSFTAGAARATEVLARGFHIGVSGMVTFPKADAIREAVRVVPRGRLLVETDTPYLAPVPHRGKANEPAFVRLVAEAVASESGRDAAAIERETDRAFVELFL